MKKVVIIGGSGHGKVIADIVVKRGDRVVGFLDDNTKLPKYIIDFPYLGVISKAPEYEDCEFVIGIGYNNIRRRIAETYDLPWYTAIHPNAIIGLDVEIGEGSVVMANATINSSARVGKHCIINTGADVEHDNVVGNFTHISPRVALGGTVKIGENCHIGIGATVKNNLKICDDVVVGAGAVVVKDIEEPNTYVGVPVRPMEKYSL